MANITNKNLMEEFPLSIEETKILHEIVSAGNIHNLQKHIAKFPTLKFAYDEDKKSLLTRALECKEFEIFAFLQSEGFAPGIDDSFEVIFQRLSRDEQTQIAHQNLNFFDSILPEHIKLLVSKTKLATKTPARSNFFREIHKFYTEIDAIVGVSEVLHVVASIAELRITFDFESNKVARMHPVASNCDGIFYEQGYIYIAAGRWEIDRDHVVGVIAHEFTHCVCYTIFCNSCLPYAEEDSEREERYNNIVENIRSIIFTQVNPEITILQAFSPDYQEGAVYQELIVRIPHVLAQYKDDNTKITELRQIYGDLFYFYEKEILPEMQKHIAADAVIKKVETLNAKAGVIEKIRNEAIDFGNDEVLDKVEMILSAIVDHKINLVFSNSPVHAFAAFHMVINELNRFHISMDLNYFTNHFADNTKLLEGNSNLVLLVFCSEQVRKSEREILKILNLIKDKKNIFFVTDIQNRGEFMRVFNENSLTESSIDISWFDFTEDYQKKLLSIKIEFLGNWFELKHILNSKLWMALSCLPLSELVGEKELKIKAKRLKSCEGFTDRKFVLDGNQAKYYHPSLEFTDLEIMEKTRLTGKVIIAGLPGSGKSCILIEITRKLQEKFPSHWVAYIDLKQHYQTFDRTSTNVTFEELASQLVATEDNMFEREIFKHLYGEGRTVTLFDGFDEISPKFKEKVSSFLAKFNEQSGNQLWITTRTHLQGHLKKTLDCQSYQLVDLNEKDQIAFLTSYWRVDDDLKIKDFVNKFSKLIRDTESFVGSPLLLRMIAETYKSKILNQESGDFLSDFNLFTLYLDYVGQMFVNWRHEKGHSSREDQLLIDLKSENVMDVHQKVALEFFNDPENLTKLSIDVSYNKNVWTPDAIARVGLIHFESVFNMMFNAVQVFQFLHRTFAEFFVAYFIVTNITEKKNSVGAVKLFLKTLTDSGVEMILKFIELSDVDDKQFFKSMKCLSQESHQQINDEVDWVDFYVKLLSKSEVSSRVSPNYKFHEMVVSVITTNNFQKILTDVKREMRFFSISYSMMTTKCLQTRLLYLSKYIKVFSPDEHRNFIKIRNYDSLNIFMNTQIFFESFECWIEELKKVLTVEDIKSMMTKQTIGTF